MLGLEEGIEIVGTAQNGEEAIDAVRRTRPDVAVLDLEMPKLDGLEAATSIRAVLESRRVVLLARHARPAVLRRAPDAGAQAFVTKATSLKELPHILRVHDNGRYVDGTVATAALSESNCPLSGREIDVPPEALDGSTIRVIVKRTNLAQGRCATTSPPPRPSLTPILGWPLRESRGAKAGFNL